MGTFLDRYLQGEHKAVWDELVMMGSAIQAMPLYADALDVAHETMRRARYNIELLIPRLVAVGYQFGYGWVQPFVRERLLFPYRANYDPAHGGSFAHGIVLQPSILATFDSARRRAYIERLDVARDQPLLFVPATDSDEGVARLEHVMAQQPSNAKNQRQAREIPHEKLTPQMIIAQIEAQLGSLPLSIRAWYEVVGSVNFVGDHPGWRQLLPESEVDFPNDEYDYLNPMHVLDPLVVLPLDEKRLESLKQWSTKSTGGAYWLPVAEDEYGKYLDGAQEFYQVALPSPAIDVTLTGLPYMGEPTFVAYLSTCFQWGGFPGWARLERHPENDLMTLTKDLLPIY